MRDPRWPAWKHRKKRKGRGRKEDEEEEEEEVSEEMAGQDGAHLRPSAGPYIRARYDVPPRRALCVCVRACRPTATKAVHASESGWHKGCRHSRRWHSCVSCLAMLEWDAVQRGEASRKKG